MFLSNIQVLREKLCAAEERCAEAKKALTDIGVSEESESFSFDSNEVSLQSTKPEEYVEDLKIRLKDAEKDVSNIQKSLLKLKLEAVNATFKNKKNYISQIFCSEPDCLSFYREGNDFSKVYMYFSIKDEADEFIHALRLNGFKNKIYGKEMMAATKYFRLCFDAADIDQLDTLLKNDKFNFLGYVHILSQRQHDKETQKIIKIQNELQTKPSEEKQRILEIYKTKQEIFKNILVAVQEGPGADENQEIFLRRIYDLINTGLKNPVVNVQTGVVGGFFSKIPGVGGLTSTPCQDVLIDCITRVARQIRVSERQMQLEQTDLIQPAPILYASR